MGQQRSTIQGEAFHQAICRIATAAVVLGVCTTLLHAEDVSAPATLQMFEAKWNTIEDRQVDLFYAGYGAMWLPPPQRGDTGGLSVGYDLFDRFDLGTPSNQTLYGTETGLKSLIGSAHRASVNIYTDLILNHNGFGDSLDAPFVALGGYPGFVLSTSGDPFGDFHDPAIDFGSNPVQGQLAGLVDIAQEKNHPFIRHPVDSANPNNIPAGSQFNIPDPNNARFYPDQGWNDILLNDPELGGTFARSSFNSANPLGGDAVSENALGLMMRNAQWMVQVIGVDGFRLDAVKHMPEFVLDHLDQALFRANPRLNHDGTFKPVYSFSEILDGNQGFLQTLIRRDLPNSSAIAPANTTVGGNRDALDFPLFFALRENLTGNGAVNNWHSIRGASQDLQDDGLHNGSQGVSFVDSHDNLAGGFPFLKNVAYAYTLMRPGNALVYLNAKEFGEGRDFPNDGKDDALGGFYGDAITRLVGIRESHGRGNFHERWIDDAFNPSGFSNIYVYERENAAVVALNSRADAGFDERSPVQTGFAPGEVLVELTGNAADAAVDPGGDIPEAIRVDGSGQVTIRIPRNGTHGRGYVIYGLATPEGTLSLAGVASTLAGATPTAANNGTARLGAIDVITANSFNVQLSTTPVTLPTPFGESLPVRDEDADGDAALLRIDEGIDLNNLTGIDFTTPGSIVYGFEEFTDTRTPGYIDDSGNNIGTGVGTYAQTINTTQLAEGRHFITVRAFRHRDSGPAVFTDFKRAIYVDRLPPESEIASFAPYGNDPEDLDLVVHSIDETADAVHVFLDTGAAHSEAEILSWVNSSNLAANVGGGQFKRGYSNVALGNHVATVVMFEPTGNFTVRRFVGLAPATGFGAGFGDTDHNGFIGPADMLGFETALFAQNDTFEPTADTNADGLVDNRDLFQLDTELLANGASQPALDKYLEVLSRRGDFNSDGATNGFDIAELYNGFGIADADPDFWLLDLNVDGVVDIDDVTTMITEIARSAPGDFDIDGDVDGADFLVMQRGFGTLGGALYTDGDVDLDGDVDGADRLLWESNFGFITAPLISTAIIANSTIVPEPAACGLALFALLTLTTRQGIH